MKHDSGNGNEVMLFAGTDPREDVETPGWWNRRIARQYDADADGADAVTLRDAIRRLPRAVEAEAGWKHPATGEWMTTGKHNALIDPDTVGQLDAQVGTREEAQQQLDLDGDDADVTVGDDALWHIPTDDYEIINPAMFLDPLVQAIEDHDLEGVAFGEFDLQRGGGRVRGDIYFDAHQIELDHIDNDPVMLGIEVGWDFFGGMAAYAQGIGMDTGCTNSMRRLTDKITVRHRGSVADRIDFWDDLLERINLVADQLVQMIADAEDTAVSLRELPFDVQRFYELLGYPEYLAERAAEDVRANADDPWEPTMWDLHSGATYAITHHARGSAQSIQDYHRRANDLLMNPAVSVEQVEQEYEREEAEQTELGGDGSGVAALADLSGTLQDKREQYESREDEIKGLFDRVEA